jgi:transcriptional regulator GlxA family with amidase domain
MRRISPANGGAAAPTAPPVASPSGRADENRSQEIGFILVPGFALMSFASATEPFRAANRLAGRALYTLRFFGEGPSGSVASSSGAAMPVEALPGGRNDLHTVFVCAGGTVSDWSRPAIHACLRRLARQGTRIGGISGGPYILAAAGLLDGRDFTVHWEHDAALREAFPHLHPRLARFVVAQDRVTCGGGIAPIDMAYALIAERMGPGFARRVSDWFLHTAVGAPEDPQRAPLTERYGIHHPALVAALDAMEKALEIPLGRRTLAVLAGVSERQLDRLFRDKLGRTPLDQYRAIRLDHARRLLHQSPLSIGAVAALSGFPDATHFARCYRRRFGHTPSSERPLSFSAPPPVLGDDRPRAPSTSR